MDQTKKHNIKKYLKKYLLLSSLVILANASVIVCILNKQITSNNQHIISVYDGDTFIDNKKRTLRLFGVDTPEMSHSWDLFKPSQSLEYKFALEAKDKVIFLVNQKNVDIKVIKKDTYNRIVSKVSIANLDLGLEMIKSGLAIVQYISLDPKSIFFTSDKNYYEKLIYFQNIAMKMHIGFWFYVNSLNYKIIYPNPNVKII